MNFQHSFLNNLSRENARQAVQVQVKPKSNGSPSIVFYVIPINEDTAAIGFPREDGISPPFYVTRQGEENQGWNNFSYLPAAIAYSQSQKPCTNLEEFLSFLDYQQNNPASYQAGLLNFDPDSDMAKILSHCQSMYLSEYVFFLKLKS